MPFADLLTQTAVIQEQHATNVGGVVQKNWSDLITVPARLEDNVGRMRKGNENLEKYVIGEFTLYVGFYPDITEKMRVVMNGQNYQIAFVAKIMGRDSYDHLELQLNKITA